MGDSSRPAPSVVVPGNHDGVHRGHRALLRSARERARADGGGLRVVAMFFDPHPLRVLAPDRAPPLLTTGHRRAELLRGLGADAVVRQPFDAEFAHLSPESFAREVLVEAHGARAVVVGPDFRFGRGRSGTVDSLRILGERLGFDVVVREPVMDAGRVVSSTRVRNALTAGHVVEAARLLGRLHELEGEVVPGDRRGRELGFPTANLVTDAVLAPADGIYAVVARRLDLPEAPRLVGAASLGDRPTFEGATRSTEVYLLDFEGDLYGARLRLGFVARLRGEERFDDVEALVAQMHEDVEGARAAVRSVDEELLTWI